MATATKKATEPTTPDYSAQLAADIQRTPRYSPPKAAHDLPIDRLRVSCGATRNLVPALAEYHRELAKLKQQAADELTLRPIDVLAEPIESVAGDELNRVFTVTEVLRKAAQLAAGGATLCGKLATSWTAEMHRLDAERREISEMVSDQLRKIYTADSDQRFRARVHEAPAVLGAKRAAASAGKHADSAAHESGRLAELQLAILVELDRYLTHVRS